MIDYTPLFYWVRAREDARILKDSGAVPPYSTDPILPAYPWTAIDWFGASMVGLVLFAFAGIIGGAMHRH